MHFDGNLYCPGSMLLKLCAEGPPGNASEQGKPRISCTFEGNTVVFHICWPSHERPALSNSVSTVDHVTLHLMTSYCCKAGFLAIALIKKQILREGQGEQERRGL